MNYRLQFTKESRKLEAITSSKLTTNLQTQGIVNGYTFWSNLRKEQNCNLVLFTVQTKYTQMENREVSIKC